MWRDFFFYSRGDKTAILLLSVGIVLTLFAIWVVPRFHPDGVEGGVVADSTLNAFRASISEKQRMRDSLYSYPKSVVANKQQKAINPVAFDPNLADSLTLLNLGLPSYVARNILNYRARGGVFRTPESLAKIYGLTDEYYRALQPYVYISEQFLSKRNTVLQQKEIVATVRDSVFKYPEGIVIDLNAADTAELKKIPGIGSAYARRIVAYRTRLGGFYKVEQLQEQPALSPDLNRWFTVNTPPTGLMNINKANIEQLRNHPYLNFYQAKAIIEYRRKRGKLKHLSQLSLYEEFTAEDLERLEHYVEL